MNPTERMMLHLLDSAVRERAPDPTLAEGVCWQDMFMLAQAHKIDALLLEAIVLLPDDKQPPANVFTAWQESAMLTVMGQALMVGQTHELLGALEAEGIKPVVFKGIAIKPLYPQPDLRTMSDVDLLVKGEPYGRALELMQTQGFALVDQEPGVNIYGSPDGLRVELHAYLFDKAEYGFLSRLEEEAMFPVSLAVRAPVYGGEAWVFPPKEHALYMLCHMAKHMITTGFGLRQAMDFALFAEANDETMDWKAFYEEARVLGLYDFACALLALGASHLSLPKGKWAGEAKQDPEAAEGLLMDLLDAGVFGNRTEERRRSAAVVYRSVDAKDGDTGRIRRAIFPSAGSLKAPYLYARNRPALLPVAWVHRWANYLVSLVTGKASHKEAAAGMKIADERLRLLDRLGLRDDAQ